MTGAGGCPARLERCARLFGLHGLERLRAARVVIIGLGGVGSFAGEALARSGIGELILVDHDVVAESNLNRQLGATASAIGRPKTEVLGERLRDVAPDAVVEARREFCCAESLPSLLSPSPDWVIDAIDSLGPKIALLRACQERALPVVTALGAGGRLDPTRVRVASLAATHGDPLGVQVRKQLRRSGSLEGVTAVFTAEPPRASAAGPWERHTTDLHRGRQRVIQPSAVMVPAAMGLAIAAHVVAALTAE